MDHLQLSEEELAQIDSLIEEKRETHIAQLASYFMIREYGNKARVGWFDQRGELCTMQPPRVQGFAYRENARSR
jgi:hypothetical protein